MNDGYHDRAMKIMTIYSIDDFLKDFGSESKNEAVMWQKSLPC